MAAVHPGALATGALQKEEEEELDCPVDPLFLLVLLPLHCHAIAFASCSSLKGRTSTILAV
jgi:hypothetical protein